MIVCSEHARDLRTLICECGLGYLLHQPYGHFADFTEELCGRRFTTILFDPLSKAYASAEQLALSYGGAYLNEPTADGHARCPLCELVGHYPAEASDADVYWLAMVVGEVKSQARVQGLLPRAA